MQSYPLSPARPDKLASSVIDMHGVISRKALLSLLKHREQFYTHESVSVLAGFGRSASECASSGPCACKALKSFFGCPEVACESQSIAHLPAGMSWGRGGVLRIRFTQHHC